MNQDRQTLGILLMIAFAAIAPGMDAFAKATPSEVPVGQVLGFRFGIQAAILLPIAVFMGIASLPRRGDVVIHILRAVTALSATGFFFLALRYMPIANAIAIFFVEPFIVALMGAVFLGEPIGPRRLVACGVGFLGALLVIQPSFHELGLPALYPLGTATLFGAYLILTRKIATREHPVSVQAWTAVAASLIMIPLIFVADGSDIKLLDPVWPSSFAWVTLFGVGLIATVSHVVLSMSLKLAPASVVAPFQYFEIVAATILGLVFFGDFPNALTWVGIFIIVGSGLYLFAREKAAGQS